MKREFSANFRVFAFLGAKKAPAIGRLNPGGGQILFRL
jgi:hypothetical protein